MKSFDIKFLKKQIAPFFDYPPEDIETKIHVIHEVLTVKKDNGVRSSEDACFFWPSDSIWVSVINVIRKPAPKNYLSLTQKIVLLLAHELVHAFQYYTESKFSEKQANDIACEICGEMWECQLDWPVA